MLYSERHRPRGVGLAAAVHRTWAVAEKNDWQFSNPRIDTAPTVYLSQPSRGVFRPVDNLILKLFANSKRDTSTKNYVVAICCT